jgi:hypothetical protein
VTTALLGGLALLIAALVPPGLPRRMLVVRGLGAAGAVGLLFSGGGAGSGPFVLLAVAAAADAVEASTRAHPAPGGKPALPVLGAGAVLVLLLASAGHGMLLGWSFVVGKGAGGALPGAGVALGFALLAGLAALCLLTAATLVPEATAVRPIGVGALWAAFLLALVGDGIAHVRALRLSPESLGDGATTLALLLAATGALGSVLVEHRHPVEPGDAAGRAALATHVAAALVGLAALEPTRWATARRLALLAALLLVARG